MATRSYDPADFYESVYSITLPDDLQPRGSLEDRVFRMKLSNISSWIDQHCEGAYMILIKSVWFESDKDALIFKMGYAKLS